MPSSRILIASNTLSSSAASVTFSSIPATYTDLVLRWSARSSFAAVEIGGYIQLNETSYTTTNYSITVLEVSGGATNSYRLSSPIYFQYTGANATSNTFGSAELYIPNYAGATNKPSSSFGVLETNAANAGMNIGANLKRNTAAVSSITFLDTSGNFVSGSSFFLYGLKNS